MKKVRNIMAALFILCATAMNAQPMNYNAMRNNARFLTDRMAYTLGITTAAIIDDIYRINYDYICGVNDYLDDVALGYHNDIYMEICYERDRALQYLLGDILWNRLIAYDYFYRPIAFANRGWRFAIYAHDMRFNHYYCHTPRYYNDYRGGHFFNGMAHRGVAPINRRDHRGTYMNNGLSYRGHNDHNREMNHGVSNRGHNDNHRDINHSGGSMNNNGRNHSGDHYNGSRGDMRENNHATMGGNNAGTANRTENNTNRGSVDNNTSRSYNNNRSSSRYNNSESSRTGSERNMNHSSSRSSYNSSSDRGGRSSMNNSRSSSSSSRSSNSGNNHSNNNSGANHSGGGRR